MLITVYIYIYIYLEKLGQIEHTVFIHLNTVKILKIFKHYGIVLQHDVY